MCPPANTDTLSWYLSHSKERSITVLRHSLATVLYCQCFTNVQNSVLNMFSTSLIFVPGSPFPGTSIKAPL